MNTSNPALIVIDVQKGIDESDYWGGERNNPLAEENIADLMEYWRKKKMPIIFVKHDSVFSASPFYPGQRGNDWKESIVPQADEMVISKSTTNAFVNTSLHDELTSRGIEELVIVGFVTNNSVEASARMAGDLGYKTIVVSDATACFDKVGVNDVIYGAELIHLISLSNLKGEYADILNTTQVLKKFGETPIS
jgi:nicotinamidase-related amidase